MLAAGESSPNIDERILMAIVRVSERFKRKSSAIFVGYGLSFSQYNVLRVLDSRPDGQGSITDISRQLLVSSPNLSGIAKRLEKAGFVRRGRDAADERRTLLVLRPPGKAVLEQIRHLQEKNIQEFLAVCPADQKRAFLDWLKTMLAPGG
jgi:DNA-binding MarR family transcriptional regulator